MRFTVCPTTERDKDWTLEITRGWGADFIVTRGRRVFPAEIEGFLAVDESGRRVGLITYEITGDQCEAVSLDTLERFAGIGTALMDRVCREARARGCRRLWFITTNDNVDAIRFYQRRGFTMAAVHVNALAESRRLKPSIPLVGCYGIPIRDEIEFEMILL
jgi:N-acetylglutamate synthase-like GNAT family acetyltransferase